MKKFLLPILFVFAFGFPFRGHADGYPEEMRPHHRAHRAHKKAPEPVPEPTPPPTCIPSSREPKVRLASWDPKVKVGKLIGSITECVTTMWDVLRLLPGPNVINVAYPSEKEQWVYSWMWTYKLQNPMEDTIIFMDNPGKHITKGKNPVELSIVFNKDDVVERVTVELIKN